MGPPFETQNNMNIDLVSRLREFLDDEARSCSMDSGCVTPEYIQRMWGGTVVIEDIKNALDDLKTEQRNDHEDF